MNDLKRECISELRQWIIQTESDTSYPIRHSENINGRDALYDPVIHPEGDDYVLDPNWPQDLQIARNVIIIIAQSRVDQITGSLPAVDTSFCSDPVDPGSWDSDVNEIRIRIGTIRDILTDPQYPRHQYVAPLATYSSHQEVYYTTNNDIVTAYLVGEQVQINWYYSHQIATGHVVTINPTRVENHHLPWLPPIPWHLMQPWRLEAELAASREQGQMHRPRDVPRGVSPCPGAVEQRGDQRLGTGGEQEGITVDIVQGCFHVLKPQVLGPGPP